MGKNVHLYPPLSVGVSPNSVHSPTDMSRELRTVTTAARARPHLDFTMSILIIPSPDRNIPHTQTHVHTQGHNDWHETGLLALHRLTGVACLNKRKKEDKQ
uniref:Uncharacterized protein n=1 Tax=Anabas testudineus TaxID=64144 RepID=A0A7N5ZRD9_ANATE